MSRMKSSLLNNILFYEILLVFSLTLLSISFVPGLIFLLFTLMTAMILPYIFKAPDFNAIDAIGKKSKIIYDFYVEKITAYQAEEKKKQEEQERVKEQENTSVQESFNTLDINANQQPLDDFRLKKKGKIINVFIFIFGALPLFYTIYVISDLIGINLFDQTSIWILIIGILAVDMFYYLPTFLYYSGNSGKIIIFLLNILVSWTLIGWLLLLFFVISRNNKYRHQNELIHVIKQNNINQ